jgi:beta-lactam-binding protein with PASTA domain
MQLNFQSVRSSAHRLAALAAIVLLGSATGSVSAQTQPPFPLQPVCSAPPAPEMDGWPVAVTDSLGSTAGVALTFPAASLLSNDRGNSIAFSSLDSLSTNGGRITGTGPFTYTPAALFTGTDTFSYEISDAAGQTAIGVVSVVVTADVVPPAVSLAAPLGGAIVGGSVLISASATDNVGVTGVTFYDGGALIADVPTAPFQTNWQTALVTDGSHVLSAVARDAAGNTSTSALVPVTVRNLATVPNIIGLTQAAAQQALTDAGLTVGTVSSINAAAPAGQVVSQSPGVGVSVAPSSAVAFTVSLGPALVTVPNVVGLAQAAAQSAILGAGLTLGAITNANSATVPAGAVISESPAAGASVAPSSAVALVVSSGPAATATPAVDRVIFSEGLGKRTTAAFSTTTASEMLVAFAASDGPAAPNSQSLTIAGAGLTWTRVQRAATQFGVAEIWTARASAVLTNVTVSSTQSSTGVHQSLTVIAFTGVGGVGASSAGGASTGAPAASLTTTAAGSVVYAVGNDWDRAVARTLAAGQTKVHEFVDTAVGDTFWVEAAAGTIPAAGASVTLGATAPTSDQWNLAIVELTPGAAPVPVNVPNVVGLTQAAAQAAITGAGLTAGAVTTANSASVPAGQVISQTPAAGASVAPGSAVALVVSLGPAPITVAVPNVVGLTQAAAQTAITGAGLVVGTVSTANSASVPAGQVISQTPAAGSSVAQNSAVALVVSLGAAAAGPAADTIVFSDGTGPRTTAPFTTAGAGEVLLAFAASDGPTTGANTQSLTISGAGLTWTRVQRAATERGVAEIWTATAPAALINATVTSTQSVTSVLGAPVNQSLTVVAFTGASGVGASNIGGAISGAPTVSVIAQAAGSLVYAVGNDFDRAVARTIPAGQTKVHEFFAPTGDTFWVQSANSPTTAAGATVTLNATAPTTDQWNFAIVELKR